MNIQQAIDAPRIHHQWLPDELVFEPYGLSGDTQKALTNRGHKLSKPRYLGDAEGIMIEEKTGCVWGRLIRGGVMGWRWGIERVRFGQRTEGVSHILVDTVAPIDIFFAA
jgi:hypothetical protein